MMERKYSILPKIPRKNMGLGFLNHVPLKTYTQYLGVSGMRIEIHWLIWGSSELMGTLKAVLLGLYYIPTGFGSILLYSHFACFNFHHLALGFLNPKSSIV